MPTLLANVVYPAPDVVVDKICVPAVVPLRVPLKAMTPPEEAVMAVVAVDPVSRVIFVLKVADAA